MADIVIKFNTNDKSLEVTMDGESMDNIDNVSIYKRGGYELSSSDDDQDEYYLSLCMSEPNEEHDYRHIVHISAADSQEAIRRGVAFQAQDLPDYVTYYSATAKRSQLKKAIGEYIRKNI